MSATTIDLQRVAKDHLWMHFTRMGGYADQEVPIIVRGDGCYLEDANGKRYLDALAGLFSVNIGYSFGEEIGQAALEQMRELPFYTNWSYAHPRAIELAGEVASLAPGDLNRVFFVSGGSEAVESAWKLARQYYAARGEKRLRSSRTSPSGGTTRSSPCRTGRAATGDPGHRLPRHERSRPLDQRHPALRTPFEPLVPDVRHVRNTNRAFHRSARGDRGRVHGRSCWTTSRRRILAMGPETVCMVHMEPVQNAGGAFTPPAGYWQGVRALCDEYDILLSADEVITGFGRLGLLVRLGALRHPARHRHVREGALLVVRRDRRGHRDRSGDGAVPRVDLDLHPRHHLRRAPHDVRDRAQEHRDHEARGHRRARPRDGGCFREKLETLLDLPIVGDVRGTGFFYAIELVKDRETRATFDEDECETLLRGFLSGALFDAGLICQGRRPRRPRCPDLAAARRDRAGDRRTRRDPRRRARRGRSPDGGPAASRWRPRPIGWLIAPAGSDPCAEPHAGVRPRRASRRGSDP